MAYKDDDEEKMGSRKKKVSISGADATAYIAARAAERAEYSAAHGGKDLHLREPWEGTLDQEKRAAAEDQQRSKNDAEKKAYHENQAKEKAMVEGGPEKKFEQQRLDESEKQQEQQQQQQQEHRGRSI
jgi:hypothetical protein